ncbi:MAG TPA: response regulator, partial [Planctomycetota bacterium]|nr:response regulator [Planctomycetota bacterium]
TGEPFLLEVRIRDQGGEPVVLCLPVTADADEVEVDAPNAEASVKGTLRKIARIVEEQNPGYKCSILLVAHGRFVSGAGPSLPAAYNEAIDGYAIGPNVGSCGTAIYWNVPVIVTDIQQDPLWAPFAELARTAGVAACWSHPFSTKGGRVLGALALYSPVPRAPTAEQLDRLRAAAQMTGLAVERGRAEEELRSANQVKARFLANMSHEIRTPLNALVGIADSLEGVDGEDASIPGSEVLLLRDASEQLLELFSGILDLTEVRDRQGLDKVIQLHAFIQQICNDLGDRARAKGLGFECQASARAPRWVTIDAWAFERALKLLIDNAIKFTHEGEVKITADVDDDRLIVAIIDTGCGIDFARLNELRAPFVQGDSSTTKRYPGFGLGLALSDLCIHALGGKIDFAPTEGGGTTVKISLPLHAATAPAQEPAPALRIEPSHRSLPVLVVEDNPINSKVIERILERSGYACDLTVNGQEALQAISAKAYSCILMDCQMPVMDGYEATRRIRMLEEQSGQHIPIIAVTANALAEDRDRCLSAGMDEYLKKPVRPKELIGTLAEFAGPPTIVE